VAVVAVYLAAFHADPTLGKFVVFWTAAPLVWALYLARRDQSPDQGRAGRSIYDFLVLTMIWSLFAFMALAFVIAVNRAA
jgi:hypothetical protein